MFIRKDQMILRINKNPERLHCAAAVQSTCQVIDLDL